MIKISNFNFNRDYEHNRKCSAAETLLELQRQLQSAPQL